MVNRERLMKICDDWGMARLVNPRQRMYHQTRVSDFPVMMYEEFERQYGPTPMPAAVEDSDGWNCRNGVKT